MWGQRTRRGEEEAGIREERSSRTQGIVVAEQPSREVAACPEVMSGARVILAGVRARAVYEASSGDGARAGAPKCR